MTQTQTQTRTSSIKWMIPGALLGFAVGVSMCALIRPAHSSPHPYTGVQLAQVGELNDGQLGASDVLASQVIQAIQIERLQKNVRRLEDWQIGATLRLMNLQTEIDKLNQKLTDQNQRLNRVHRLAHAAIKAQKELRALKAKTTKVVAQKKVRKGKVHVKPKAKCKCKAKCPSHHRRSKR